MADQYERGGKQDSQVPGRETKEGQVEADPVRQADWRELQKVRQALTESEERFRAAFEQAPVGIVQGDLRGALRLSNRRIRELFGIEEETEFLNLRLWDCTHPADLWTVDQFKDLLAGRIKDYVVEKRYLRKDGSMWWARVSASMVRDDSDRPKYFIVIVEDINDRKLAEEALLKAHEEMEAKVAERTVELAAANTALKVLLDQREHEKKETEQKILASAKRLILPFLDQLLTSGLNPEQRALADVIKTGVQEITSPFGHNLSSSLVGLTPRELSVAALVKEGKASAQIAEILGVSENAVAFHRQNIRRKLGILKKNVNLCSYLNHLPD
jgi:PAS domain S-box-containing protein